MIKKFHAHTTRDALRQVRDALGADAMILSNRQVAGGVEIIAVADMDVEALSAQAEPSLWSERPLASPPRPQPVARPAPLEEGARFTTLADYLAQRESATVIRPARGPEPARPAQAAAGKPKVAPLQTPHPSVAAPIPQEPEFADEVRHELRQLRGLVEGQLAGFAWGGLTRRDPLHAEVMKRLLAAGFSNAFSNHLLGRLPQDEADLERALKWLRGALARNLKLADTDIIEQGGVYALVGPTGVGKTTTVAKLAARAVLRHGANKVALVTTDTYRIGAQDQLRIYGRILGVPVFAVRDESDLELTLSDLATRHLVLIDTVGMSQRDKRVAEQINLLCGDSSTVQRLLLLGAPCQGVTLEEVARAYAGPGLIGSVLTKIDEALTFGPVLDVAMRHELPLHFITNGQRVPEDLHLANAAYLIDRAFRLNRAESPFSPAEDDYPILMAANRQTMDSANGRADAGGSGASR
ncbi:MAG: flagellar biosynthesis protein FlhF [Betaproteobacteria bacterium]|nr:flagellar biosynthesis protein FlhF [Betaproteobacteria bacterium]